MRPIRTLVEAVIELERQGRLSDETRASLIELAAAENYRHPDAVIVADIATEATAGALAAARQVYRCHYEEMESVRCPICKEESDAEPG